jgi:hypothetical protein
MGPVSPFPIDSGGVVPGDDSSVVRVGTGAGDGEGPIPANVRLSTPEEGWEDFWDLLDGLPGLGIEAGARGLSGSGSMDVAADVGQSSTVPWSVGNSSHGVLLPEFGPVGEVWDVAEEGLGVAGGDVGVLPWAGGLVPLAGSFTDLSQSSASHSSIFDESVQAFLGRLESADSGRAGVSEVPGAVPEVVPGNGGSAFPGMWGAEPWAWGGAVASGSGPLVVGTVGMAQSREGGVRAEPLSWGGRPPGESAPGSGGAEGSRGVAGRRGRSRDEGRIVADEATQHPSADRKRQRKQ